MQKAIEQIKGIHPREIVRRELERRKLKQGPFALCIMEYPQVFNAVLKGRRRLNPKLAIRIERALELEHGFLTLLQVHYVLRIAEQELASATPTPDSGKFRKALFWDTSVDGIDWVRQKSYVLQRVKQYGNLEEIAYFDDFYGLDIGLTSKGQ